MSLSVLLFLSLLTVQCGGCDFDKSVVENVKATIDSNPTGFRTAFPKDYYILHHYTRNMLCETDPCCVFPAAMVLLNSWEVLLTNLWKEHVNHSLIVNIKQTLEMIITKNIHMENFQEETEFTESAAVSSSPEELLKLTSDLYAQWLKFACLSSMETCQPPTLPPSVERKNHNPSRPRLLTTRAISSVEMEQQIQRLFLSNMTLTGNSPSVCFPTPAWTILLFGFHWWLLP